MEGLGATADARLSLERAGMPAADLAGRLALVDQVVAEFTRTTGRPPAWAWWVPGRIEIFGKHTDYAGGRSLVAAVPRGFVMAAGPRPDDIVAARDVKWHVATEMSLAEPQVTFTGWANYVAVVARRLAQNFPGARLGADIAFASDLPRAAGVSSSSALVVGVATALVRRAALEARQDWAAAIRSPFDLAGYLGAVENGLTFGALEGTSGVGTHGGSEDHTAILTCRAERVSAYSYVPVRSRGDADLAPAWRFVVMSSGVEAAKAGGARAQYNRASLATRALLDVWRRHHGAAPRSLGAALEEGPAAEAALREAIHAVSHPDFSRDELLRRLAHFIAEDGRVPLALEAFRRSDADALGILSAASQQDAEQGLQNQVPQTSALAAIAREAGAFASSSFGGGFGGSVWALVDAGAEDAAAFSDRWRRRYLATFPESTNVGAFVARPAPAVTELRISES